MKLARSKKRIIYLPLRGAFYCGHFPDKHGNLIGDLATGREECCFQHETKKAIYRGSYIAESCSKCNIEARERLIKEAMEYDKDLRKVPRNRIQK